MSKEAMKQALDALENSQRYVEASANGKLRPGWGNQLEEAEDAITALRKALAEQPASVQSECLCKDKCLQMGMSLCKGLPSVLAAPVQQEPVKLPSGSCASEWGGRPTGPCLYTDEQVLEIVAANTSPQPAQRKPLTRATIADARDYLNTNDKAMWVLGWNECVEAHNIKEQP